MKPRKFAAEFQFRCAHTCLTVSSLPLGSAKLCCKSCSTALPMWFLACPLPALKIVCLEKSLPPCNVMFLFVMQTGTRECSHRNKKSNWAVNKLCIFQLKRGLGFMFMAVLILDLVVVLSLWPAHGTVQGCATQGECAGTLSYTGQAGGCSHSQIRFPRNLFCNA